MTREEIEWIWFSKKKEPEPESKPKTMFKCPKSHKCVSLCFHKKPHEFEPKYCSGKVNPKPDECPGCIEEELSDCVFFEEDFKID